MTLVLPDETAALLGAQSPRVRVSPTYSRADGDDASFLSSSYGLVPDEWQADLVRDTLAVRSSGQWVSSRCGWSVSRQNGKNVALRA